MYHYQRLKGTRSFTRMAAFHHELGASAELIVRLESEHALVFITQVI